MLLPLSAPLFSPAETRSPDSGFRSVPSVTLLSTAAPVSGTAGAVFSGALLCTAAAACSFSLASAAVSCGFGTGFSAGRALGCGCGLICTLGVGEGGVSGLIGRTGASAALPLWPFMAGLPPSRPERCPADDPYPELLYPLCVL